MTRSASCNVYVQPGTQAVAGPDMLEVESWTGEANKDQRMERKDRAQTLTWSNSTTNGALGKKNAVKCHCALQLGRSKE